MQDATFQFINSPEGPEKLARAIFEEVKKGRTKYVIDGIRNIKTLVELKKVLEGKLALIYIETNPEDAFEYYRKREDPHVSFDEFLAILSHPVEREIPYFAQRADAILYNYGSTESFVGVFEEFLKGNPV